MFHSAKDHGPSLPSHFSERPSRTPSRARSTSPLKFFASSATSPPLTSPDSQRAWTASYLTDLRSNRPARPSGSRPIPNRDSTVSPVSVLEPTLRPLSALSLSRPSCSVQQPDLTTIKEPVRCSSIMSHRRAQTVSSDAEAGKELGRPLVQEPHQGVISRDFSISNPAISSSTIASQGLYMERGQRWMEKQEARSLREALEEMDLRDEARLHAAAQNEASELVWKHRNPDAPYRIRDKSHNYKKHLEEGSHARSQSLEYAGLGVFKGSQLSGRRSASDGSSSDKSQSTKSQDSRTSSGASKAESDGGQADGQLADNPNHASWDSPQKKAYVNLTFSLPPTTSFGRRKVTGPKSRRPSGSVFSNPNDKIYEEPDDLELTTKHALPASGSKQEPLPLKLKTKNSVTKFQNGSHRSSAPKVVPDDGHQVPSTTEIYRNPPSQSRNPSYVRNTSIGPSLEPEIVASPATSADSPKTKNGVEIRGDDIRSATTMRMKDRSPRLPSPTVVSDKPGRPIVSFDKHWTPKNSEAKEAELASYRSSTSVGSRPLPSILRSKPPLLESTASAPVIPTINISEPPSLCGEEGSAVPTIAEPSTARTSVSTSAVPSISLSDDPFDSRPLPSTKPTNRHTPFRRPLPQHSSTAPVSTFKTHWSPSCHNRPTAQCAACALPIAGRIVSALSQRFHPQCFTCFHCSELLECVAFYPEPSISRDARLARIEARASDPNMLDLIDGQTAMDDGDSSLRFFCHLDFHEIFSPRCRSCKTPIEGEIVVACGGEWHKGHFFCAECGDPFDEKTPFVERNGYAWCVGCHAGRFNGKCKGCRKVILEQGIQALGGEWHEACFCCVVSRLPSLLP